MDQSDEDQDQSPFKRKPGLFSIVENLKIHKSSPKDKSEEVQSSDECFGDTAGSGEAVDASPPVASKPSRRRRADRTLTNNNVPSSSPGDFALHNNNNHVKNERLSPGTPDTSSRSRSVTPSSATHPDTPPASENPLISVTGRNYSDFMRSLAAKYNNANPNDYFSNARNGFPPPLDPRFKAFSPLLPNLTSKDSSDSSKKPEVPLLNPFTASSMFPPLIDMSTTHTLLAMVRTAREAEVQGLLKNAKRQETSSPLDLSAAAPPPKKPRIKTPSLSGTSPAPTKTPESSSPRLHEDVSHWSVEDVCSFVASIDICSEYVQTFREQSIDGAGLPMLTEDHLTSTMNMKLGPALKLRAILAKKLGSCNICLHCSHCHSTSGTSPEPTGGATGNNSDSGGS